MSVKVSSLFLSVLLSAGVLFNAQAQELTKAEVESIIDEYVSTHPEIIVKALKKLEQQETQKALDHRKQLVEQFRHDRSIPSLGSPKAKHYIIEFYDYNCGYCKVMEPLFEKAINDFDVQIVYVNIPVVKEESKQLAIIGQAVFNLAPHKYFKFHQHFMQPGLVDTSLKAVQDLVESLDIKWNDVVTQMKNMQPQKQIGRYIDESMKLKIAGTPYLLIDGEEYRGAITSYDTLTELLKD